MNSLQLIHPVIRVAHPYRFPAEQTDYERERVGYCYAFHYIDGGRGSIVVSDQTYPIAKGDLVYLPPLLPHIFRSDSTQPLSTINIYCELWPNESMSGRSHLVWNPAAFDPSLLTAIVPSAELEGLPFKLPLHHDGGLIEQFVRIVKQHQKKDLYSDEIAESLLKAFVLEWVQMARQDQTFDYRIRFIIDQIDKEASASSDYQSWLTQSGLGKTQFHSLFKQATGLSPGAYRIQAVMKRAAAALRESRHSVTSIADDLGYLSIHHFTKQFTAYYGIPPTEFRSRHWK